MSSHILEVRGLSKRFGGIVAADNIALELKEGEVVGLIGPNGAGKTSLFNLVSGTLRPDAGRIKLRGKSIERASVHGRARMGLTRTWQNVRLFPSMSILDNLMIAPRLYAGESFLSVAFRRSLVGAAERSIRERAFRQLEKVRLTDAAQLRPAQLSYGKQKLASIARALMNDGECLLLDEPIAGVEGAAYEALRAVIRSEAQAGRAICIVEHNISFVRDLCDRALFMFKGRIIESGSIDEFTRREDLAELYFGAG